MYHLRNSLQNLRTMILWSKTIKIIPMLHFILCVSSHEESENILDDGQQCISTHQKCHILNYIDDIETVNNEGSKKIKIGPSNIQLDIINTEKSKALKEFLKLSQLVNESEDGGKKWFDNLSKQRLPFNRRDKSNDNIFYNKPRLVTHIDDSAIGSLSEFYSTHLKDDSIIVDLCSSWVSHLPYNRKFEKVIGIGMNQQELKTNSRLDEFYVHDLNSNHTLSMLKDTSVDHVIIAVSVDYLIRPYEVFYEVLRTLKSGGSFVISFSNRYFPTKVIEAWTKTNDAGRINIVWHYFYQTNSDLKWRCVHVYDISKDNDQLSFQTKHNNLHKPFSDPMYVLVGIKM